MLILLKMVMVSFLFAAWKCAKIMCFNMESRLAAQMLSSGVVVERRSQFLGGFLACLFARLFVFAFLFRAVLCLAVLAIEEPLGILVESRLDLAQLCSRSLKFVLLPTQH